MDQLECALLDIKDDLRKWPYSFLGISAKLKTFSKILFYDVIVHRETLSCKGCCVLFVAQSDRYLYIHKLFHRASPFTFCIGSIMEWRRFGWRKLGSKLFVMAQMVAKYGIFAVYTQETTKFLTHFTHKNNK